VSLNGGYGCVNVHTVGLACDEVNSPAATVDRMSRPQPQKRATVHDIAAAAGVSRGTVSRVLNGGYVSAEARAAIEAAMSDLGYVPNNAARALKMRRSQAVAFVALEPHSLFLDDPNIGSIMLGANAALSLADHQMVSLVVESARDTERVSRYLSGGFVDGAIVVSARAHDPIIRVIRDLSLPAAFVGHPPDLDQHIPFVGIDNVGSARAITDHLVTSGRRRIGMIAAALDRDSGIDRLAGFRAALGPLFDEGLVADVPHYDYGSGVKGMRDLLERDPSIDGVFAASDAIAAGALEALREAGRSVPADVGVVGFDDSTWAVRCQPQLTTVHQPAKEIGSVAAQLVLRQLRGEHPDAGGELLPTPLVLRDSA
jgi:DNA-binding LacI/PurR family transcriptional regulator